jgi:hypothetical protein
MGWKDRWKTLQEDKQLKKLKEKKRIPGKQESASTKTTVQNGVFSPADPNQRRVFVEAVRRRMNEAFPNGWKNLCGYVAFLTLQGLERSGISGYRIAAGRVEVLGNPLVVRFQGVYTATGESEYHAWVVGPEGEKLDCSALPRDYDGDYIWEPYTNLPQLKYTEERKTTESVRVALAKSTGKEKRT